MKKVAPFLFLLLFALPGQKSLADPYEISSPTVVIGTDDRVAVSETFDQLSPELQHAALAVGHIGLFCTVTHLGNGLALTAGHCFLEKQLVLKNQPCGDIPVVWGPGLGPSREVKGVCKKIIIARISPTTKADYAFIEVEGVPQQKLDFNWGGIQNSPNRLTIFSKAGGKPYQWSKFCRPFRSLSWVFESPSRFEHSCDTQGGSSGAAILSVIPHQIPKIVGIHFGGDAVLQRNMATNAIALPKSLVEQLSKAYGLII